METTETSKFSHRKRTTDAYHRAVERVIAHLAAGLAESHTLEDMADIAMISPFHFNRIFREVVGLSPVRYLYAMRIEEAKRLILTTPLKIIDICYAVGYNSLGSFNKRFVSLVGCSPRRIRSLAACVDPGELRRRVDARLEACPPADRRERCSVWGTVQAPRDFSGVVMAGLYWGASASERPIPAMLPRCGSYAFPPVPNDADCSLVAVGLLWHASMADFLLQPSGLLAILPSIHLVTGGRSSAIDLQLAARRSIDPLMPPSLTFTLIQDVMQLPIQAQEDDIGDADQIDAWVASSAAQPARRTSSTRW